MVFQLRIDTLALSVRRAQVFSLLCMISLFSQFSEVTRPQAFVCKRRNSVNIMEDSVDIGSVCVVFFLNLI